MTRFEPGKATGISLHLLFFLHVGGNSILYQACKLMLKMLLENVSNSPSITCHFKFFRETGLDRGICNHVVDLTKINKTKLLND